MRSVRGIIRERGTFTSRLAKPEAPQGVNILPSCSLGALAGLRIPRVRGSCLTARARQDISIAACVLKTCRKGAWTVYWKRSGAGKSSRSPTVRALRSRARRPLSLGLRAPRRLYPQPRLRFVRLDRARAKLLKTRLIHWLACRKVRKSNLDDARWTRSRAPTRLSMARSFVKRATTGWIAAMAPAVREKRSLRLDSSGQNLAGTWRYPDGRQGPLTFPVSSQCALQSGRWGDAGKNPNRPWTVGRR